MTTSNEKHCTAQGIADKLHERTTSKTLTSSEAHYTVLKGHIVSSTNDIQTISRELVL